MKTIMIAAAALAFGTAALTFEFSSVSWAQAPAHTVWEGVYTTAQATTGKAAYDAKCTTCHGAELSGAEMAPPLAGGVFLGNWSGQSVGDLATRIHTTMPANDPGSLSNQETADIVAYILSFNQFPAGSVALASDPQLQAQIAITAEKPAAK
jgi:mono/diheme cytochrome c family protein